MDIVLPFHEDGLGPSRMLAKARYAGRGALPERMPDAELLIIREMPI
jgi:hypothetical protein